MSDKDRLLAFLMSAGFVAIASKKEFSMRPEYVLDGQKVIIGHGQGYVTYRLEFSFDANGKFLKHAITA